MRYHEKKLGKMDKPQAGKKQFVFKRNIRHTNYRQSGLAECVAEIGILPYGEALFRHPINVYMLQCITKIDEAKHS